MDGVLKSWAVPKGFPTEQGVKRLVVAVDDHSLSYASFEGEIPEGVYGTGRVKIWDSGEYTLQERTEKKMEITLNGTLLKGNYEMVFMREERGRGQWLIFKRKTG
jgi:DNA ligase D-like protein (predicted 3'-phosphoesterase)